MKTTSEPVTLETVHAAVHIQGDMITMLFKPHCKQFKKEESVVDTILNYLNAEDFLEQKKYNVIYGFPT